MGTPVQVKPLCGVYNENSLSYLVSVDGFNYLIDYGWNDHFDTSLLEPLSRWNLLVEPCIVAITSHCGKLVIRASHKGGGNIQYIILEGPLSEEYYKNRDHLYSQFYAL